MFLFFVFVYKDDSINPGLRDCYFMTTDQKEAFEFASMTYKSMQPLGFSVELWNHKKDLLWSNGERPSASDGRDLSIRLQLMMD